MASNAPTKRLRNGASALELRAVLSARVRSDFLPAAWLTASGAAGASTAGNIGVDAFLCQLGRSVVEALRAIPALSEAARAKLRSVRATLHAAVDLRCNELEAIITSAESSKVAASERQLCAVDVALERWRTDRRAVADIAAALDDVEIDKQHMELGARLDATEEQLQALSTSVVEPPYIGLAVDEPALLACLSDFGKVVAPLPIIAADLQHAGAPAYARPGDILRLRLEITNPKHAFQSVEELGVSLSAAAAATRIEALLEVPGKANSPRPLLVIDVCADVPGHSVAIAFQVPFDSPTGAVVSIVSGTVCGQLLLNASSPSSSTSRTNTQAGSGNLRLPVGATATGSASGSALALQAQAMDLIRIPVRHGGMRAPLRLDAIAGQPGFVCISPSGVMYALSSGKHHVLVFDRNGVPLPGIPLRGMGPLSSNMFVAFADGRNPTLLVAHGDGDSARLAAIDPITHEVRWALPPGRCRGCNGMAALPHHGVVFAASAHQSALIAYRLSDGTSLGSTPGAFFHIDSEPATGAVYGNRIGGPHGGFFEVVRVSWSPITGFNVIETVAAAGMDYLTGFFVAVVPPAPGKQNAYLVIFKDDASELLVLDLPSLIPVHTHMLEGMRVCALAADPWGEAIAVTDSVSNAIHVLSWPLAGMRRLE